MTLPEALAVVMASLTRAHGFPVERNVGQDMPDTLYDTAVDVIRASAQQTARNHG